MSINRTRAPRLLILLVLLPVLVVNLSSNIFNLNSSGTSATQNTITTTQSASTAPPSTVNIQIASRGPSNLIYYYLATAGFAFICGVIYRRRRRRKKEGDFFVRENPPVESRLSSVIALCMIVLIIFGAIELVRYLTPPNLSGGQGSVSLNLTKYFTFLAFAGIVGISVYGLFILYRSQAFLASASPQSAKTSSKKKVEEFRVALDRAVYSLDFGSDYRSTIIQTYKDLCSIIEERGMPQDVSLTPREFELAAQQKLGIFSGYLHDVTLLFEKARYGNEEIVPEDALRASDCFRNLSSEIARKNGISPRAIQNS